MGFYFAIFAILLVSSALEYFGLRKRDVSILYWFYCLLFFVLSFIRWEMSGAGDWTNYLNFFTTFQWQQTQTEAVFEWGYTFMNYLVGLFTDNYTVLLFSLSIILYAFQSKAIAK